MLIDSILANEYAVVVLGIILAGLLAKIAHFILSKYIKALTQKTKTDFDDKLLEALGTPFVIGVIFSVLFFTAQRTHYVQQNKDLFYGIYYVLTVLWILLILQRICRIAIETWLSSRPGFGSVPQLFIKLIYVFIYLIGLIIILKHFNVEISPLIATLGIGGLAVGLALQDTLSNFFAGIHIASDRPIRLKDFIEIENGSSGYVEEIGWRTTRIKTLYGNTVVVPNARIAGSIITNNDLPVSAMILAVNCGVSYQSDLKKVEKLTIEVAKKIQTTIPGAVKDFEPVIRYNEFGESNINFKIILKVEKFQDKSPVTHELIKELKEAYDKHGIEISWPVRKVFMSK